MFRIVYALFFLITSDFVHAEWIEIANTEHFDVYTNNTSTRSSDTIIKSWVIYDFKKPNSGVESAGKVYSSILLRQEFDCQQEIARGISQVFYSNNMAKGEVVYTSESVTRWYSVAPDSVSAAQLKVTCKDQ